MRFVFTNFWYIRTVESNWTIQEREVEVEKTKILYGMSMGATAAAVDREDDGGDGGGGGTRVVRRGQNVRTFSFAVMFLS
jgi:hypothetical protein